MHAYDAFAVKQSTILRKDILLESKIPQATNKQKYKQQCSAESKTPFNQRTKEAAARDSKQAASQVKQASHQRL